MLECRWRVGYTIDMSVNLGNSSHFDVNDASQGYSLWTEEMIGHGKNWFFVLTNVHGQRPVSFRTNCAVETTPATGRGSGSFISTISFGKLAGMLNTGSRALPVGWWAGVL